MNVRQSPWFYLTLAGALGVLAFLFLPILVVIPVSFTDKSYLALPGDSWSWQHYAQLIHSPMWRNSLIQSISVAIVSTFGATMVGACAAIGSWKLGARMAGFTRVLAMVPLVVPTIVGALAYYRLYIDLGLLDTFVGVIITHIIAATPFVFIAVGASLEKFDQRIEYAARSMGASPLRVLRDITLPGIKPGLISGALFAFIVSWDELVILLFITTRKVYLLPRAIWDGINENVDPSIAAVATIMVIITFIGICIERAVARHKTA